MRCSVARARDDVLDPWCDRHARNCLRIQFDAPDQLTRCGVPHAQLAIAGARYYPGAVIAKGDARHCTSGAFENSRSSLAGKMPDANGLVPGSRGEQLSV